MTDTQETVGDPQAPVDKPFDANALIGLYLDIRNAKRAFEKQVESQAKQYTDRMEKIELALHKYMQDHKLNSLPTDAGTAYISTKNSATVTDGSAFRGHIIETRDWDLADWRANVTATKAWIDEHGVPVPGVTFRSFETVRCRKATETNKD